MRDRITPADLRERVGMTQMDLAVALGKSLSTVAKWEVYTHQPKLTFTETIRLTQILRCSLQDLAIAYDRVDPNDL